MEVEDKEIISPNQQEKDVRFELEMENSNLQNLLSQQVEKCNHDMEMIIQVCGVAAPCVIFADMYFI